MRFFFLAFIYLLRTAWVMRIISAFTTRRVLVGAVYSSSDMCHLSPSEVRDHFSLTRTFKYDPEPILRRIKTKNDTGLKGKTIHIRIAGMDAPEVSESHTIPYQSSPFDSSHLCKTKKNLFTCVSRPCAIDIDRCL
jgi:endonuclease YncB( thermonuclease family)